MIDFDNNKYCITGFKEKEEIVWDSSFTIEIGSFCSTGLTKAYLYLNFQDKLATDFDIIPAPENISHFIGSMKKWALKCPKKFRLDIIYKTQQTVISMGE